MATLNESHFQVFGLTLKQVGEGLLRASPQKDGRGLTLILNEQEEALFMRWGSGQVLTNLDTLIKEAVQNNKVSPSFSSAYNPSTRTFTTT